MASPSTGSGAVSASSLSRLLARLHSDTEQAGREYVQLRRALVRFFDWRGASAPDECADETLDRLAVKVENTVVDDLRAFAYGIAGFVLRERSRARTPLSLDEHPRFSMSSSPPTAEDDPLQRCFYQCLDGSADDSRSLMLRYYEGQGQAKISNRGRLAAELGLTENALRCRIQRLRDRLERCVRSCLAPEGKELP